jgi:preprotein translocase subunit SecG
MFTFLLVVHAIIAAALVTVILMQRSEGGGLGMGGGPAGLMTARGAADFLTRATAVLATLFVLMAFLMAALAASRNSAGDIDTSLANQQAPDSIAAPTPAGAPGTPGANIPMMGGPAPAVPDAATAQGIAPAAAGLPTRPAGSPDAAKVEKAPAEKPAKAPELKTIQTKSSAAPTAGLNGVSSTAPAKSSAAAAPAAKPAEKPVPTLNIAPPPASTGGNQQ